MGFCNLNYTPVYRGFDSFYGYYNAAEDYYNHNVTLGTCEIFNYVCFYSLNSFEINNIELKKKVTGLDFIYQNRTTSKAITDQNGTHSMVSFFLLLFFLFS
jgi:hypothetical protein